MQTVLSYLDSLGIRHHTVEHPPFFTAEEGLAWHDKIPGMHCKTLFLKDKKDQLWLVVIPYDRRADLNALEKKIGSARLSFGKPDLLQQVLRLTPGSVTPFAVLHDAPPRVRVVLDKTVAAAPKLCFHPMRNDRTTIIDGPDLPKFLNATGHAPLIADCA